MGVRNKLPNVMSMALAVLTATVLAAPVGASTILGTASITDGPNNQADFQFVDNTAPVSIFEFEPIPGINTVLGIVRVNGTSGGTFNLSSFGQEVFENESVFSFSDVISNTGSETQAFSMNFNINAGKIENRVFESPLNPPGVSGEFLESGYEASIRINGVEQFFSGAVLRNTSETGSLTKSGVDLLGTLTNDPGAPSTSTYEWMNFLGVLDLGVLDPGETLDIDYEMRTFVSGLFDSCGSRGCGSGNSIIGDPLNVSSIGGAETISSTPVTGSVPEPTALALMGLGLVGLGFCRQRKVND